MSENNTTRIKSGFENVLLEILEKGAPLVDKDGTAVVDEDGVIVRRRATHQELAVIRAYLKDLNAESGDDALKDAQPGALNGTLARFQKAFQGHTPGNA